MRIYLVFLILVLTLPVAARRSIPTVTDGSLEQGGGKGDFNTDTGGPDNEKVSATGSGTEDEKVTPRDGTSQSATYKKIQGRQVKMQANPSPFDISNIGTPMVSNYNLPMMLMNNLGNIGSLFEFEADDYVKFVPLGAAEVDGVKGYLGSVRRNGRTIRDSSGHPREFFVPMNQYKNMSPGYLSDLVRQTEHWNHIHKDKDCTDSSHAYYETPVEQREHPRDNGYLKGCEALGARDMGERDINSLSQCVKSIKAAISVHSRVSSDGGLESAAWKCNAFAQLNSKEEEFAGLIFGAMAEGEVFLTSSNVAAPRYQELAFIMKVQQNRARELKRRITNNPELGALNKKFNSDNKTSQYNALDVTLSCAQFSAFNGPTPTKTCNQANKFNGAKSLFEPNSTVHDASYKLAIRAFLNIDKVKAKGNADNIYNYFAPYAMAKVDRKSYSSQARKRKNLIKGDLIPDDYPSAHRVPNWWDKGDSTLIPTSGLRYQGNLGDINVKEPNSDPSHIFYTAKNPGRAFIGNEENMIKDRAQCDIPNITDRTLAQQASEDINDGDNRMLVKKTDRPYYGPQ